MPRKTPKAKSMIKALAEWAVDDALASREKFPGKKRRRLPRSHYKQDLKKSKPPKAPQTAKGKPRSGPRLVGGKDVKE